MRILRVLVVAWMMSPAILAMSGAQALSCAGPTGDWARTVFVASVVAEREVEHDRVDLRLEVDEVWRGSVDADLWVTYESIWSDPFPEVGRSYVVALHDDGTTGNCAIAPNTDRV